LAYIDRIRAIRNFDAAAYRPFRVGGRQVGLIHAEVAGLLEPYRSVLVPGAAGFDLAPGLTGPGDRSAAMADVLADMKGRGLIKGWRDEAYAVRERWGTPVLMEMERAAVPLFGVEGYGVHVNGFVRDGDEIRMWIGRRSLTKPTGPGKLDQVVAGGQPAGIGVTDNLIKECGEEAAIPEHLARRAHPVGAITYCTHRAEGLRRDVLFNFDLELPRDFTPTNTDGEVAEFMLWPMDKVMSVVRETDEFKFNCGVIVIDFLLRRGFIGPDDPDYLDLLQGMHRRREAPPEP